jgi:hypothetical protein
MRQAALPQGHNDCVLAVASLDLGHALPTDLFRRYARSPKGHIHLVVRPGRSDRKPLKLLALDFANSIRRAEGTRFIFRLADTARLPPSVRRPKIRSRSRFIDIFFRCGRLTKTITAK